MAKAKREALEKAGTYIESLTVVQNSKVEKDEILALAAGVLKAEVVSQKNYHTDDAFGMEIVVNVVVDTSLLEDRVKKQLQDRAHLNQLKETQEREKKLLQKVAQLEEENRKLSAKKQSTKKLKKEFQQASQKLKAVDWYNKALSLLNLNSGELTESKRVIEYLNNAIKLQPDYTDAHINRGSAYIILGQYQLAIADINQAMRLKPDDAYYLYYNRANAYSALGLYQRAIEDYNEALRQKPDDILDGSAYRSRGNAYAMLGQYQLAIEDYSKAIQLRPDHAVAYYSRGTAYSKLSHHQSAIEDYNEAIRLKPDYADAYYNRGYVYLNQGTTTIWAALMRKKRVYLETANY
ncbi:MAG: tetratricopeptide repeat protein [Smithella sp.]